MQDEEAHKKAHHRDVPSSDFASFSLSIVRGWLSALSTGSRLPVSLRRNTYCLCGGRLAGTIHVQSRLNCR